ncbi:LysR family transcriptional regulator [Brucellaceae bacterium D45D]
MELKLLEDIICVYETRNFSRAATIRNVTQSALSKRIKSLEYWAGVQLIDRSSYPVNLTSEGRAMIPQARELVTLLRGMRAGLHSCSISPKNTVRLGALHTLRLTMVPKWHKALAAEIDSLQIEFKNSPSAYAQTVRLFRNGENDLLLTYVHPAVSDGLTDDIYESLFIAPERIIPVSAPDADGQPLHRIDENAMVSYLSYGQSSFFARALAWLFAERPLPLNVTATNAMSVGLMSLAEVGCGVAWVPESLMADKLAAGTLVPAGGPEWTLNCEVRLFRPRQPIRAMAERVWQASQKVFPLGTDIVRLERATG